MMTSFTVRDVGRTLVGGGLTGVSAAREIRERDPYGGIQIVASEPELPYHHPLVSKEYLPSVADA